MGDYGLARLKELTERQISPYTASNIEGVDEIVEILSSLAASLRDGEYCLKSWLTCRVRAGTAAGLYHPQYTCQITTRGDWGR